MTPALHLYSARLSMFGAKVQIALHEKGLPFELEMVAFTQAQGYSPKHPEVVRINPKKQVPVLLHGDLELFDSTQILEYIEDLQTEPPLWPRDIASRARARQLEHMSDEMYFPHVIRLMSLQDKIDDPLAVASIEGARDYYLRMEPLLEKNDYLAGDFSYADIALYMAMFFGTRMQADLTPATPRLLAWRDRISARASVRRVIIPMGEYLASDGRPVPDFVAAMAAMAAP